MKKKNKALILILLSFSFLVFLGATKVEAACCNADADCSGGYCACDSCDASCDCGDGRPECCRYDGVCDIGNPGGEDCLNKGFAGSCVAGGCYCTSDCPGGNGGNGDTYWTCDSNCNCVEVDGSGTNQCSADGDCYPCGECIPCDCGTSLAASEDERHFAETFINTEDEKSSQVLGEKNFEVQEPLRLTSSNFLSYILDFINNFLTKVKLVII